VQIINGGVKLPEGELSQVSPQISLKIADGGLKLAEEMGGR